MSERIWYQCNGWICIIYTESEIRLLVFQFDTCMQTGMVGLMYARILHTRMTLIIK